MTVLLLLLVAAFFLPGHSGRAGDRALDLLMNEEFLKSAERATFFLLAQKKRVPGSPQALYKLPVAFGLAGRLFDATLAGELLVRGGFATEDAALSLFPRYMPTWALLGSLWFTESQGTIKSLSELLATLPPPADVFSLAHEMRLMLAQNRVSEAETAARTLVQVASKNRNRKDGKFFFHYSADASLVTQFPDAQKALYVVDRGDPSAQLWFFLGYPAASLVLLAERTGNSIYHAAAKTYLDYCYVEHLEQSPWAHKVAWAAALSYQHAGSLRDRDWAVAIMYAFVSRQNPDGYWGTEVNPASLDQTAEISIWMRKVHALLSDGDMRYKRGGRDEL